MKEKVVRIPSTGALEAELERSRYRIKFKSTLRSTIFSLVTIAAVAVLISTLALPVFRIYGTSMTPTLDDGNLIVALKGLDFEKGDIIAFYYNNKILVKRVIATSGDWVDIDEQGNVIGEPTETALVQYAYQLQMPKYKLKTVEPRVSEVPFDSNRKMMSTLHKVQDKIVQYTKGAPDVLLQR